jgi:hypothetical protein
MLLSVGSLVPFGSLFDALSAGLVNVQSLLTDKLGARALKSPQLSE